MTNSNDAVRAALKKIRDWPDESAKESCEMRDIARAAFAPSPVAGGDLRAVLGEMPTMRAAFRTTVSGDGKYEMVFRFPSMGAMHAADDEWRAALNQPAAPVEAVERALPIVAVANKLQGRQDHEPETISIGLIRACAAVVNGVAFAPMLAALRAQPPEPAASTVAQGEIAALRSSLQGLLDACYLADAAEELPSQIDGALLDAARDALELQYPVIWTDHQVAMLRGRQSDGSMHPYTCGGDRSDAAHVSQSEEDAEIAGLLYPTVRGWRCPACDYRQFWSHETGGPATHHKGSSDGQ